MLASELAFFRLGLPRRFIVGLGHHLDRRLPRLADHVISVTERIRNDLVEGGVVAPGRISVIGNGVELERFDPDAQPSWQTDAPKRIMFTGNLAPYQGIDILLAALAAIVRQRRDVRLVVVTDSDFSSYAKIARQLGVEDLIELVPAPPFVELPTLLTAAHIAVNPRVAADGAPVKLLNYLAAGKPVVSFEGSAPGLTHGQTAWLVRGGDPVAFAGGIVALLEAPERAQAMGRNARSFVEQHYRWPVIAARIEDVYRSLLAPR